MIECVAQRINNLFGVRLGNPLQTCRDFRRLTNNRVLLSSAPIRSARTARSAPGPRTTRALRSSRRMADPA